MASIAIGGSEPADHPPRLLRAQVLPADLVRDLVADLRLQLRRPPTLQQPKIEGVWVYPQPVPVGIATSRRVRGEWYDLFITHQVVFPVSPGEIRIAPAELQYGVPVAYQFFSREERFTVTSDADLKVGDIVTISGVLAVGKDFGAGYAYDAILENGKVVK